MRMIAWHFNKIDATMKNILYMFMLLQVLAAYSQKQGNIWYFGLNAGVNFNTTPPTALLDGQVTTYEGSASIADENVLFTLYTHSGNNGTAASSPLNS